MTGRVLPKPLLCAGGGDAGSSEITATAPAVTVMGTALLSLDSNLEECRFRNQKPETKNARLENLQSSKRFDSLLVCVVCLRSDEF